MGKKLDPWIYNATLLRVVDGDTADAAIDCGFNISVKKRIRFKSVDTWESRTRNLEEKKLGLKAKAYTKEMLERNEGKFTVKSHGVGKYGRLLGEIFIKGEDKSLNQLLIDNGHAYEYEGGKKKILGG
jgi:micrococcal nuclease